MTSGRSQLLTLALVYSSAMCMGKKTYFSNSKCQDEVKWCENAVAKPKVIYLREDGLLSSDE